MLAAASADWVDTVAAPTAPSVASAASAMATAVAVSEATVANAASAALEAMADVKAASDRRLSTTVCPVTTSVADSTVVARASLDPGSDPPSPARGSTKWFPRARSDSAFMFER